ncbi:hypothetical protein I6L39_10800 [Aeromonas sp. FDAARGOS 1409]|uniref:xylulokinase n=1 Tax=Aeromonas TaxID=642 RepID=UPI001C21E6C2|nr:FGGY family carbohydrate kinase [Aeromonas sp. FDAARGOS 1409]QXC28462.1 hypothetical protein I6L39_10800 [Aeromonas sp. FDAARGOS 1409]
MKDTLLTLDIGTGSTRAGLVSHRGDIIGFAQREYGQITPQPGWVEQPPSLWWQSACEGIRELLHRYPEYRTRIAAVAVCGQMHGTVLLDADGELVCDSALLWNDKRAQPQVAAFRSRGNAEHWLAHLNNPPTPAWPAFKMAWLREHQPQLWERVASVLMPKDYINFRLSGVRATDYSEASCYYLLDSTTRQWSASALAEFGFSATVLPSLHNADEVIGQITAAAAQETGLPVGIPVVAGVADMAATLLGSGVWQPGSASDSTGTSTLLTVVSDKPLLHPQVNNLHLANPAWGGFTILDAGGDAMRWWRQLLGAEHYSHPQLLAMAETVPANCEGLLFVPYLTGERLGNHTNSRAQFFGLQRKHSAAHLTRAVLEGVALAGKYNLDRLTACTGMPSHLIASGGGARSTLWLEIKAAAYNLPILKTANVENGTTGCAIIAGVGVGLFSDIAAGVQQCVSIEREILPDPRLRDDYQRAFLLFQRLCQQTSVLYDDLDSLSSLPSPQTAGATS